MKAIALMLAAQALSASSLTPTAFYVAGVQQGMTLAEYNALIANGDFKSQPVQPNTYIATINQQNVVVTFCQDHVVGAVAEYSSWEWMQSIKTLEDAGFTWSRPVVTLDANESELRTGSTVFGTFVPKGYTYGVIPMLKAATLRGHDMPTFQLSFQAIENPCRQ